MTSSSHDELHVLHIEEPTVLYCPLLQGWQEADPVTFEKVPAGLYFWIIEINKSSKLVKMISYQKEQDVLPGVNEAVPIGHGVQELPPPADT